MDKMMERPHDILKLIGLPMLIGGSAVYAIKGSTAARNIGAAGATVLASWLTVDLTGYNLDGIMKERKSV